MMKGNAQVQKPAVGSSRNTKTATRTAGLVPEPYTLIIDIGFQNLKAATALPDRAPLPLKLGDSFSAATAVAFDPDPLFGPEQKRLVSGPIAARLKKSTPAAVCAHPIVVSANEVELNGQQVLLSAVFSTLIDFVLSSARAVHGIDPSFLQLLVPQDVGNQSALHAATLACGFNPSQVTITNQYEAIAAGIAAHQPTRVVYILDGGYRATRLVVCVQHNDFWRVEQLFSTNTVSGKALAQLPHDHDLDLWWQTDAEKALYDLVSGAKLTHGRPLVIVGELCNNPMFIDVVSQLLPRVETYPNLATVGFIPPIATAAEHTTPTASVTLKDRAKQEPAVQASTRPALLEEAAPLSDVDRWLRGETATSSKLTPALPSVSTHQLLTTPAKKDLSRPGKIAKSILTHTTITTIVVCIAALLVVACMYFVTRPQPAEDLIPPATAQATSETGHYSCTSLLATASTGTLMHAGINPVTVLPQSCQFSYSGHYATSNSQIDNLTLRSFPVTCEATTLLTDFKSQGLGLTNTIPAPAGWQFAQLADSRALTHSDRAAGCFAVVAPATTGTQLGSVDEILVDIATELSSDITALTGKSTWS